MENKPLLNKRTLMLLAILVLFAVAIISTSAEPVVMVDADDVVKVTKIVNYQDKMGNAHYGAKMNIIIFKRRG